MSRKDQEAAWIARRAKCEEGYKKSFEDSQEESCLERYEPFDEEEAEFWVAREHRQRCVYWRDHPEEIDKHVAFLDSILNGDNRRIREKLNGMADEARRNGWEAE